MTIVKRHPPTLGFADSVYSGLNAFYFVNESDARVPVRWSLTPLQQALAPSSGRERVVRPARAAVASRPVALAVDADCRHAVSIRRATRRCRGPPIAALSTPGCSRSTRSKPTPAAIRAISTSIRWCCRSASSPPTTHCSAHGRPFTPRHTGAARGETRRVRPRSRSTRSRCDRRARSIHPVDQSLALAHSRLGVLRPVRRFRHGQLGEPIRRVGHPAQDTGRDHSGGGVGARGQSADPSRAAAAVYGRCAGTQGRVVVRSVVVRAAADSAAAGFGPWSRPPGDRWSCSARLRLPRIAPFDAQLFWLLRQAHSVTAYALMAVIAGAHLGGTAAYRGTARRSDRAHDVRVALDGPLIVTADGRTRLG